MTARTTALNHPREGMMATVRNRNAVISRVKPLPGEHGLLHLVELEYTDFDGRRDDTVIWEREVGARLIEPGALPEVHATPPMPHAHFDALVRASRWSALAPFVAPGSALERTDLPLASPFHGAVQVEDFQLVPLLKALSMPRISLLLADDVGLGKTVEAGLILTELLLRRRIRRVLVMTPASLRDQWQQEMHDKFALSFDIVDRQETHALRKRIGLDANPWRTFPRIITSYHYLRQPDVLQQFLAACRQRDDMAQLPWDLLIVDEAHNLMPSPFGQDSDLVDMLRAVSPLFEHKLFLTATPHNGHTRSFSGLLELLDPVRFSRTPRFTDAEKERVRQVVVRRLKREINEHDDELGRSRRFAERTAEPLPLYMGKREKALSAAFAAFRAAVKSTVARSRGTEPMAGSFAVEVLQKRLLSSPRTFADSWYRFLDGIHDPEAASQLDLFAARRASDEDIPDDREREDRGRHASRIAGAWLKPLAGALEREIAEITRALRELGLERAGDDITRPREDARFTRLTELIDKHLRRKKTRQWADDERLIVFTEYKTTLDDLDVRLREHYGDDRIAIRTLYGGMEPARRDAIKKAFNDPADLIRVLVATDTASEGLNLQETARLLLHYDIPWNPSRLEQRNGRLDRHGQARDVTAFHFTSEDDADLRFLGRVVAKIHQIREDLGALGEIFDAAFQRRFADLEDSERVADALERVVDRERGEHAIPSTLDTVDDERIRRLCRELDLSPATLRSTLEIALGLDTGSPRLDGPDAHGRFRLKGDIPPRWRAVIDDSLRLPATAGPMLAGSFAPMVFDPALFMVELVGRSVFRPLKDTLLLHLGHPMFRHALATFARQRFPAHHGLVPASRWIVRRGPVPAGADALLVLAIEELAINTLREPFHHWVRLVQLPIEDDELGDLEPYWPPGLDAALPSSAVSDDDRDEARELFAEIFPDLRDALNHHRKTLAEDITRALDAGRDRAEAEAEATFDSRIAEVKALMKKTTLRDLERERDDLGRRKLQRSLFLEDEQAIDLELAAIEDEIERRQGQSEHLLQYLRREKARVIERVVPDRYSLSGGGVQVFPLTIEIRLPEGRR